MSTTWDEKDTSNTTKTETEVDEAAGAHTPAWLEGYFVCGETLFEVQEAATPAGSPQSSCFNCGKAGRPW